MRKGLVITLLILVLLVGVFVFYRIRYRQQVGQVGKQFYQATQNSRNDDERKEAAKQFVSDLRSIKRPLIINIFKTRAEGQLYTYECAYLASGYLFFKNQGNPWMTSGFLYAFLQAGCQGSPDDYPGANPNDFFFFD